MIDPILGAVSPVSNLFVFDFFSPSFDLLVDLVNDTLCALALAIIPSGAGASSSDPSPLQAKDLDPTGWELALVSTPGSNISSVQDRQLAGGLDTLTLSSLYYYWVIGAG
ncbi:hypothetical protein POM88_046453 [Heracleum sosnowskyi]|uniref:Uncharacterized protein n=1 Tax=Heracleum sosnowskyi TaxID=360622 RepID=A0AAD8H921_9APIA|nr:hypothetical protein POM88_046453 [Heracleum sosnowskyi]